MFICFLRTLSCYKVPKSKASSASLVELNARAAEIYVTRCAQTA